MRKRKDTQPPRASGASVIVNDDGYLIGVQSAGTYPDKAANGRTIADDNAVISLDKAERIVDTIMQDLTLALMGQARPDDSGLMRAGELARWGLAVYAVRTRRQALIEYVREGGREELAQAYRQGAREAEEADRG